MRVTQNLMRSGLCTLLVGATACATLETRGDSTYAGPRTYSGTRQDLRGLGVGFLNLNPLILLLYLVDLPLSFLADTALLPLSLREDAKREALALEHERVDRDVEAVIETREGEPPLVQARRLLEACKQLYEELQPRITDCYAIDARIVLAGGETLGGASFKQRLRAGIEAAPPGSWVSYQNPTYTPEGERVRVEVTRTSSIQNRRVPVELWIAQGADGGWRIVEETGIDWP